MIGTLCAFFAFRQTFASVWDFRFNHIVLPRTTSLFHRTPYTGAFVSPATNPGQATPYFTYAPPAALAHNLPFAREGGWGWGNEAVSGAPFDATALGATSGSSASGGPGYGTAYPQAGSLGQAEAGAVGQHTAGRHY
jgi:diacylglycerol diphosphate phosphatase / phosphatidate phosphatase